MKKMLAILLSAVMVLALLAGCGSKDNDKNKDSDTQGGDASALNVAVFYYDGRQKQWNFQEISILKLRIISAILSRLQYILDILLTIFIITFVFKSIITALLLT